MKQTKTKNNKVLSLFLGMLLVLSLAPMVSAVETPEEPEVDSVPKAPSILSFLFKQEMVGEEAVAVDEPSNHDWDLRATNDNGEYIYPDRDKSDLNYSWMYGIFAILDNKGNVVYKEGPEDLGTLNKYDGKIQYTFSDSGTYYYAPAIVEVKQEFIDGEWQKVSEDIVAKETMKVEVAGEPGEPEVSPVNEFLDRLWGWITNLFS